MWQGKEKKNLINIAGKQKLEKVARHRTRSVNVITARDFTTYAKVLKTNEQRVSKQNTHSTCLVVERTLQCEKLLSNL